MVFSTLLFIFIFLVAVIGVYYLIPNRTYRNVVLLVFSIAFYGWGEPLYVFLMLFSILMNYVFGLIIENNRGKEKKCKAVVVISVVINLLLLAIFKYTGFVVTTLKSIFPFLNSFATPVIPRPIGISFYTFQAMSYVIDVYRRDAQAQRNPLYFGTYVALFPQLIAGPIVRYKDIAAALTERRESIAQFSSGIKIFAVGLAKKVLIANQMAVLWKELSITAATNGVLGSWIGIIAYGFQLYFDFCGYSEMAIGLGRMFGFEFLKNFDYPFIAKSVTEFWRRWHISLGTWFREYVYFPLGGNKKGKARQILNIAIVWVLTGLWHGANWNYVLWGAYFAVWLCLEKLFLLKWVKKLPNWLQHIYALFHMNMCWVLFYFTNMEQLGAFFVSMFSGTCVISHEALVYSLAYLPILIIAAIAATPLMKNLYDRFEGKNWRNWADIVLVLLSLLLSTASLVAGGYNPFIYFQF